MNTLRVEEELAYGHNCFQTFFSEFDLADAVKYTDTIMEAAASYKVWKHCVPCMLLFYIQQFKKLLEGAWFLHECRHKDSRAVMEHGENDLPDITNVASYSDKEHFASPWNDFPRHLTAKQFYDPYTAVYKCCSSVSKKKWNCFLKDLTEYALDIDSITVTTPAYNLFKMHRRMLQLIEACHLLYVRCKLNKTYKVSETL